MLNSNIIRIFFLHSLRIVLIAGFPFIIASGQHYTSMEFDRHLKSDNSNDSLFTIKIKNPVTGLVIKTESDENITGAVILLSNDTIKLTTDEHHDVSEFTIFSNLITFSPPIHEFIFYPGNIRSPVTFYFIDAQTSSKKSEMQKKKAMSVPNL
jgi:hypothetical protein